FIFFFQAEDGIRDFHVTGVQTCALPICQQFAPVHVRRQVCDGRHKPGANAGLQLCDELCEESCLGSGGGDGHGYPRIMNLTADAVPAAGIFCTAMICTGTPSTTSVSPAV